MVKVKICGITNFEDARAAFEAGADLLGFIFYEPSPRYVAPEVVREIVSNIRSQGSGVKHKETGVGYQVLGVRHHSSRIAQLTAPLFIGVFVNSPLKTVAHILNYCQLDAAQLHGEESPEFVARFQGRAFKALRPKSQEEADSLVQKYTASKAQPPAMNHEQSPHLQSSDLPRLLLDAYHPTLYGGTGYVTDWTMAANIARQHSMMLAGSLSPENVAEAIQVVQPWGVDVSSGVEAEKGKKDHVKVQRFMEAAKNAVSRTS